jgi:hypothetical protein
MSSLLEVSLAIAIPAAAAGAASELFQAIRNGDIAVVKAHRSRTEGEYRTLLAKSGFQVSCVLPAAGELHVIEALPAG